MVNIFEKNLKNISEFKTFPNNWKPVKVSDICAIGRGRVISQEEVEKNIGIYPVFSSQTENNGEMGKIATYDFDGEYITWTTDGANAGTVFHRNGKFNCTNVCGTLKPKNEDEIFLEFLNYHLGRISKKYVSYHGNPKLMNGIMGEIAFPLPPLKEQQKIAAILTSVEKKIKITEQVISKYEQLKQGMTQDLLTGKKRINEQGQWYEETNFRETEVGKYPFEWEIKKLDTVLMSLTTGLNPRDNFILSDDENNYYVTIQNFKNNKLFLDEKCDKISDQALDIINRRSNLEVDDILFASISNEGQIYHIKEEPKKWNINESVFSLKPDKKIICPDYLAYVLVSENFFKVLKNESTGSTFQSIKQKSLKNNLLALPPMSEQKAIVETLNSFENKINIEYQELNKLKKMKKGLMQDLLTGKVRVKM